MKVIEYQWDHPALKKFATTITPGRFLFRQGDPGSKMFIITHGIVELLAYRDRREYIVALLEAGQFLGEKSIIEERPSARVFGARAKSEITVLELGLADIAVIQREEPSLIVDILKSIFRVAAQRLERSNDLIHVLRSSNNTERLVHLILYYARCFGREVPQGRQVLLTSDSIRYYIDMPEPEIQDRLEELQRHKLIVEDGAQFFIVPNPRALLRHLPRLKELPSMSSI